MNLPVELEFLIKASDPKQANSNKEVLFDFIRKIERWEWLAELSIRNFVAPLIFYNLKKINAFEIIPLKYKNALENQYRLANARNLNLRGVFIEISKNLISGHIDLMVLKGMALQFELYNHPALRPMIDIDLMVKNEDAKKAIKLLIEMGCKAGTYSESAYIDLLKHHYPPFIYKGISIEVHRSLFDVYDTVQLPAMQLWENAETYLIDGIKVFVLEKHLRLLHLCHHVFSSLKGGKVKLIWYLDILFFLRKYSETMDWALFNQLINKTGASESVHHSLTVINYLFNENIQYEITHNPNPQEIIPYFVNEMPEPELSHYYYKFKNIKSFPDKIKYIIHRMFPKKEFIIKKYHSSNYFSIFKGHIKEFFNFIYLVFRIVYAYLIIKKKLKK